MKLNKKGFTLIELLISLALISLVMVFLLQMLINLRNEDKNNSYVTVNQINRADLIYTIKKDLSNNVINSVVKNSNTKYTFYFNGNKSSVINIAFENNKYYISYKDSTNKTNKWEMKDAEVSLTPELNTITKENSNEFFGTLKIEIYNSDYNENNCESKNNVLDDIEILFNGVSN